MFCCSLFGSSQLSERAHKVLVDGLFLSCLHQRHQQQKQQLNGEASSRRRVQVRELVSSPQNLVRLDQRRRDFLLVRTTHALGPALDLCFALAEALLSRGSGI